MPPENTVMLLWFSCLFVLKLWDLSSLTRSPAMEVQSGNHWTAREDPLCTAEGRAANMAEI